MERSNIPMTNMPLVKKMSPVFYCFIWAWPNAKDDVDANFKQEIARTNICVAHKWRWLRPYKHRHAFIEQKEWSQFDSNRMQWKSNIEKHWNAKLKSIKQYANTSIDIGTLFIDYSNGIGLGIGRLFNSSQLPHWCSSMPVHWIECVHSYGPMYVWPHAGKHS